MSCQNCNNSNSVKVFDVQYIYSSNCTDCETKCPNGLVDGKCVAYTGPNLSCSTINTNDSLEFALQKIDSLLCASAGDYSTYNIHCLPGPITTEAQFVSGITTYVCNLNTSLTTFTGTTFPAYQSVVDGRFTALEVPGITCSSASVVSTDSLIQVLNKYCTKFGAIDSGINISGVDWDQCFTVGTPPSSISEGFDLLIDQICSVKTTAESGAVLPTFNNIGSCLPTPGASDSLTDTITKIKTRLCQTGTINNSTLSSTCVATGTDLQTLLQNMLAKIDQAVKAIPTFDGTDFTVTNVDNSNLCLGKNVALATPINQDRFVVSNNSDTTPGTLNDKLQGGTGITLDYATTPGKVIINGANGVGDHKVLADATDTTAGYLDEKINGITGSNGLSVDTSYNSTTKQVDVSAFLDFSVFFPALVNYLNTHPDQKALLCDLIATCPSPCAQPQNVSAIYISGGVTTTTTTTTTTIP